MRKVLPRRLQTAFAIAQQQLDLIRSPTVRDYIRMSISIEIRDDDTMRMRVGVDVYRRSRRRTESASTVAEKNRDEWRLMVRNHQVEVSVPVHIGDRDVVREMSGNKGRSRWLVKLTLPVAEQHRYRARIGICHDEVRDAVMVHVGRRISISALCRRESSFP